MEKRIPLLILQYLILAIQLACLALFFANIFIEDWVNQGKDQQREIDVGDKLLEYGQWEGGLYQIYKSKVTTLEGRTYEEQIDLWCKHDDFSEITEKICNNWRNMHLGFIYFIVFDSVAITLSLVSLCLIIFQIRRKVFVKSIIIIGLIQLISQTLGVSAWFFRTNANFNGICDSLTDESVCASIGVILLILNSCLLLAYWLLQIINLFLISQKQQIDQDQIKQDYQQANADKELKNSDFNTVELREEEDVNSDKSDFNALIAALEYPIDQSSDAKDIMSEIENAEIQCNNNRVSTANTPLIQSVLLPKKD